MMDQKEIDALINQGSVADFNKQQEELLKNLVEKSPQTSSSPTTPPPPSPDTANNTPVDVNETDANLKKGKVMGQLSRVTEEAEAGTNMVMSYLENVLTVVSRQQSFIKDITAKYEENPPSIDVAEALNFLLDNLSSIEEAIFSAMDAFQFQDIGRQKLMKVMYTLAKLNEYLNELLGGEATQGTKVFGHKIEKKTMEQDKDKMDVDDIVAGFQGGPNIEASPPGPEPDVHDDLSSDPLSSTDQLSLQQDNDMVNADNVDDVDSIVAAFKNQGNQPQKEEPKEETPEKESPSAILGNDDIESLIAEFQNKQK
ncbi:MAG: hypothetical protein GY940_24405 [bacterium]|nr:hypothetical protein [bacterium]